MFWWTKNDGISIALMQMSRTVLAVNELKKHNLPYIVVLTNPTTGGVTASWAMLGDILIAEPKALLVLLEKSNSRHCTRNFA